MIEDSFKRKLNEKKLTEFLFNLRIFFFLSLLHGIKRKTEKTLKLKKNKSRKSTNGSIKSTFSFN